MTLFHTPVEMIPPGAGGTGDVTGPAVSVGNDIAVFDGVTGKLIKDSGVTVAGILASIPTVSSGVWAPVDASGAGLVFIAASGRYYRIGSIVVAVGNLQYPATADVSPAVIGGLPIASFAGAPEAAIAIGLNNSGFSVFGLVVAGSQTIALSSNSGAAILNTTIQNVTLRFTAVYLP